MAREYEWVDRLEDRSKRITRVTFPGSGRIVWMCHNSREEEWDRDMVPTQEEWDLLEEKVRARYNRRRATFQDVELVVALRPKKV